MIVTKSYTKEELLAAAHRAGKLAEEQSAEAEINGSISEEVIEIMRETKLTRLLLPKEYGEPQVDLKTFTEIIEVLASYNLSLAWVGCLYSLHNILPAYLPKESADEIINSKGLISDVFAPVGTSKKVEGGYIINGVWNFASGVLFAEWTGLGVPAEVDESDKPVVIMPILHKSQYKVIKNWDTFGLRGTGSNQIVVEDAFVPDNKIVRLDLIEKSAVPPRDVYDKDYLFYNLPFYSAFYAASPAMAIGSAKRVLKEFKELTEKRVRLVGNIRESESPRSQRVLAELTLDLKAAEAMGKEYVEMLEKSGTEELVRGEFFALRARIVKVCTDIAYKAILTLGGGALYKGGVIELCLRDLISAATHKTSLYEDAVASFGLELFGFDPGVRG